VIGKSLKLTGFKEPLKIRAAEAKIAFPAKYDWDSFFRDAKHMNEMKAGERPDTIHFQNLPCQWFSEHPNDEKAKPSDKLFRRIWESFGEVRYIDIPSLDPYRSKMIPSLTGIKTFTFNNDQLFEAYVQFRDYMSFVKAMDALRGCMLLRQDESKYHVAVIKVSHINEKILRSLLTMSIRNVFVRKIEIHFLISHAENKTYKPSEDKVTSLLTTFFLLFNFVLNFFSQILILCRIGSKYFEGTNFEKKVYLIYSFFFIIQVDFDKTKHLSDESIRRRKIERERLMELEKPIIPVSKLKRYKKFRLW